MIGELGLTNMRSFVANPISFVTQRPELLARGLKINNGTFIPYGVWSSILVLSKVFRQDPDKHRSINRRSPHWFPWVLLTISVVLLKTRILWVCRWECEGRFNQDLGLVVAKAYHSSISLPESVLDSSSEVRTSDNRRMNTHTDRCMNLIGTMIIVRSDYCCWSLSSKRLLIYLCPLFGLMCRRSGCS